LRTAAARATTPTSSPTPRYPTALRALCCAAARARAQRAKCLLRQLQLPVIGQQANRASCSLECAVILTHAAQGPVTNTNEEVVTLTETDVTCVCGSLYVWLSSSLHTPLGSCTRHMIGWPLVTPRIQLKYNAKAATFSMAIGPAMCLRSCLGT
jgi:hypothetical protein